MAQASPARDLTGRRRLSSTVATALESLAGALRERWGGALLELHLFGSHARGEAHEASDVDVCVVLDRAGWRERREVIDLATDIGLSFDLVLSATVFDGPTWRRWRRQERPLVMDIDREGVAL